jgi:hypothetical protein
VHRADRRRTSLEAPAALPDAITMGALYAGSAVHAITKAAAPLVASRQALLGDLRRWRMATRLARFVRPRGGCGMAPDASTLCLQEFQAAPARRRGDALRTMAAAAATG